MLYEVITDDITTQKFPDLSGPNAALVLPQNFGWGMRHPNDTIWGFWTTKTDSRTIQVAMITSMLLGYYGVITSYSIHYTKLYDFAAIMLFLWASRPVDRPVPSFNTRTGMFPEPCDIFFTNTK